jgi:hypothetical protein
LRNKEQETRLTLQEHDDDDDDDDDDKVTQILRLTNAFKYTEGKQDNIHGKENIKGNRLLRSKGRTAARSAQ